MPRILGIDTAPDNIIASPQIVDGAIVDADINSSAGIVYSKLNLVASIVDADIAGAANISGSKLQAASVSNAGAVTTGAQAFGGDKTFSGVIRGSDGTASVPSFAFSADPSTGIYRPGSGILAVTTFGVERLRINNGGHTSLTCATASTVNALDVSATNSSNHGVVVEILNTTGNRNIIQARSGGVDRFIVAGDGDTYHSSGTAALPSISFIGDPNTGMFQVSSDVIGFSTSGVQRVQIDGGGINTVAGTNGNPGYAFTTDTNTGMYSVSADNLGFATGGAQRGFFNANGLTVTSGGDLEVQNGFLFVTHNSIAAQLSRTGTSGSGAVFVYKNDTTSTSDNRFIEFRYNGGTTAGSIRLNGGNLEVTNTSDRRIKSDIEDLGPSLGKIMALQPRQYKLKSSGDDGVNFVAQELYQVLPNLVTPTDDGESEDYKEPWQISSAGLIPYLVRAMQEQQEQIEDLKQELELIKGRQ